MRTKMIFLFLLFFISFFTSLFISSPLYALPVNITLLWDYNDAELAKISGFRVYQAVTDNCVDVPAVGWVPVKEVTSKEAVVSVENEGAYWFNVTAFNAFGESAPSNSVVVCAYVPAAPTGMRPVVVGMKP